MQTATGGRTRGPPGPVIGNGQVCALRLGPGEVAVAMAFASAGMVVLRAAVCGWRAHRPFVRSLTIPVESWAFQSSTGNNQFPRNLAYPLLGKLRTPAWRMRRSAFRPAMQRNKQLDMEHGPRGARHLPQSRRCRPSLLPASSVYPPSGDRSGPPYLSHFSFRLPRLVPSSHLRPLAVRHASRRFV